MVKQKTSEKHTASLSKIILQLQAVNVYLILTCWCLFFMCKDQSVRQLKCDRWREQQQQTGVLPCLLQDTSGFGWPCAIHSITAGRPSTTVAFWGGATIATLFRVSVEPLTRDITFFSAIKILDHSPMKKAKKALQPDNQLFTVDVFPTISCLISMPPQQ